MARPGQTRSPSASRRFSRFCVEATCHRPPRRVGTARALSCSARARTVRCPSRRIVRTVVAALFYSLIESAKLCHVEPRAYLKEATLRAFRNPGTVTLARDLKTPEA